MGGLPDKLASHRRRIRGRRAADAGLRWAFYASVAACLVLLATKFAGVAAPPAAALALVALPLLMAARSALRPFSIRDCAIHLDRLLGLDERLSTALEAPGAMGPVLLADAEGALLRAPLPPHRLPREGRLLGGSAALLAALLAIPAPGRSGPAGDPALEALSADQAAVLESMANVDVQFQEMTADAAKALRARRPEEALAILEELRRKLEEKLLQGADGANGAAQKLLDQATASAAAISAELGRAGRTVHAPPAAAAQAKLERQKSVGRAAESEDDPASASAPSTAATATADGASWNPRYDPVIRRYFGRKP